MNIFPFVVCFENRVFKYLHFLGCTRNQYRKIEYAGLRDYLEEVFIEQNKGAVIICIVVSVEKSLTLKIEG